VSREPASRARSKAAERGYCSTPFIVGGTLRTSLDSAHSVVRSRSEGEHSQLPASLLRLEGPTTQTVSARANRNTIDADYCAMRYRSAKCSVACMRSLNEDASHCRRTFVVDASIVISRPIQPARPSLAPPTKKLRAGREL